jgi:hypothetical protein
LEKLDTTGSRSLDLDHVETDGLRKRAALTDDHGITFLETETRRAVSSDVLVTLLETVVLLDVVQEITTDDDSALHFGGLDNSLQDTSADADL